MWGDYYIDSNAPNDLGKPHRLSSAENHINIFKLKQFGHER